MKLKINQNKYVIYINDIYDKQINFKDKDKLEIYFKNFFLKLKEFYNLELSGYFDIEVYSDENYGIILILEKENFEYYEYFEDKIDMRISIKDDECFLYKIDDIMENDSIIYYSYKNELYGKIKDKMTRIELGKLLEFADIIYGKEVKKILKFGKTIKII